MQAPDTDARHHGSPLRAGGATSRQPEIAEYATYLEAQATVDRLSDERFPVERLTIVAKGLRVVESITGRRGYKEAMFSGMATGAFLGAVIGFFFGLFDWFAPITSGITLALNGLIFGALTGLVVGAMLHWASAGRRDFSSRERLEADRYAILCEPEYATQASRALNRR